MNTKIKFLGAAGTVTGSCYLVSTPGCKFLVDCGMFQGTKTLKELNYQGFPFNPHTLDFVILTHAHIDHSGLVPKLCKHGFKGDVHATEGTRDLLSFMLPDSGYIQEFEVRRLNERNRRRGKKTVEPIYTQAEAEQSLRRIREQPLGQWIEGPGGVGFRFWHAGHILGSASVEVEVPGGKGNQEPLRLLFSGDIGPEEKAFHTDPAAPTGIDYLVVEGTYGDRERDDPPLEKRRQILKREVMDAMKEGGNLLIPAFAVERTQELLYDLGLLMEKGEIPPTPVFLDSPLAIRATEVFESHLESLPERAPSKHAFRNPNFKFTESVDESKALASVTSGAIIIAASGMCDAGRIRHHLRHNLWSSKATVLFVGYQAPGTLGHILSQGAHSVRIFGDEIAVRARIRKLDFYSAHADRTELIEWVCDRLPVNHGIFLTHGDDDALAALRDGLVERGCDPKGIRIPRMDEMFDLLPKRKLRHRLERPRLAPEAVTPSDWHNVYAALLLDLPGQLRSLAGDEDRLRVLQEIREVLDKAAAKKSGKKSGKHDAV